MKSQCSLLSAILILFPKLISAQIYLPEPGDFKLTTSFDFVVNTQTLPAGNYIVHRDKTSNRLQVCEDGIVCETAETTAIQAAKTPAKPMAVFGHQGDQCFLRQIWFPDGSGLELAGPVLSSGKRTELAPEPVHISADFVCIDSIEGLPPSWH
jgi:hypothetical protein